MNSKNAFIRGTLFLTFAGITSRFMGFFYRIFLANTIGAEGMGIYQLIFPIYSVCFSLCASGIETAISKLTAEKLALGKSSEVFGVLKAGLSITMVLAVSCSLIIYNYAQPLSVFFLKEPRCTPLLKLLAITIPFGTIQSCLCGYYFGIHKAGVPSIAQLVEQTFRTFSVFTLYQIFITNNTDISPTLAGLGLIIGEFSSLLFTITCFSFSHKCTIRTSDIRLFPYAKEISILATPLTLSRICINLLVSLEATMIPNALRSYGLDNSAALSIYGTLTGMALPFILFPNALTSSISLMLLPAVSELQAGGKLNSLKNALTKIFSFCMVLGCICLVFFLLFGDFLGIFIFSNPTAGTFIKILAWICPFLYLNTTLTSVLNGLGRTNITFFTGTVSLFIRIIFIFLVTPKFGIQGYLWGLLASQLFTSIFSCFWLRPYFSNP